MTNLTIFVIAAYLILILIIGVWTSYKESQADFMIANRKASALETGISIAASWFDGPLLFTTIILGFSSLSGLGWLYLGIFLGLGLYIIWAPKMRDMAEHYQANTFPALIYKRIGSISGLVLTGLAFISFLLLTALQFIVGAQILESFSPISYHSAIVVMGVVIAIYLMIGGFKASLKTDVIQLGFIFFVMALFIFFGEFPQDYKVFPIQIKGENITDQIWSTLLFVYALMFSCDGFPRVFANKSAKGARRSVLYAMGIFTVLGLFFGFMGYLVWSINPALSADEAPISLLTILLPEWAFPLVLIALFGVIMSSLDTFIMVASQSFMNDGIMKVFNINQDNKRKMLRYAIPVIVTISVLISFYKTNIVDMFLYIVMMIGIGAPALLALGFDKIK